MNKRININDYDNFAGVITYKNTIIDLKKLLIENANLIKFLSKNQNLNILDLGCGCSLSHLLIIDHFYKSHNLIGVDEKMARLDYDLYKCIRERELKKSNRIFSEDQLNKFVKNSFRQKTDCLKFLLNDDLKYNFIISNNLFHHLNLKKFHKTIQLIKEKLRDGGKIYFRIQPNFNKKSNSSNSDKCRDKTEEYLSILDNYFSGCNTFIVNNTDIIIFENIT